MKSDKQKKLGIKAKLIIGILPCFIIALLIITALAYVNSKNSIMNKTSSLVEAEGKAGVREIESWQNMNLSTLNTMVNSIVEQNFNDDQIFTYLGGRLGKDTDFPNGMYIAYDNAVVLDGAHWTPEYVATEGSWYKEGLNHKTFAFGEPYVDSLTKEYVVTASMLIPSLNGRKAVAAADVSLTKLSDVIDNMTVADTGDAFIVDSDTGTIIACKNKDLVSKSVNDTGDSYYTNVYNSMKSKKYDTETIDSKDGAYMTNITPVEGTSWCIASRVLEKDVYSDLHKLQFYILIFGVVLLVIVSVIVERIAAYIAKPINRLTKTISNVTDGDFTEDIVVRGNDEIAVMAYNMKNFMEVMRRTLGSLINLTDKLNDKAQNSYTLAGDLNQSADGQSSSMEQLNTTVEELAKAINEIAENSTSLAQIVSDTNTYGNKVADNMKNTKTAAEQGRADMNNVSEAMDGIVVSMDELDSAITHVGESTEKIDEITSTIRNIADETNLLALNASIEAARAGEAGRGFSVVADQIKHLAESSAEAADQISGLIVSVTQLISNTVDQSQDSTLKIKDSTQLVKVAYDNFNLIYNSISSTNEVMDSMIEKIRQVDDVATSVAAITEEQSAGAEEIEATSVEITKLAGVVSENSKNVESDAEELTGVAEELKNNISQFKI